MGRYPPVSSLCPGSGRRGPHTLATPSARSTYPMNRRQTLLAALAAPFLRSFVRSSPERDVLSQPHEGDPAGFRPDAETAGAATYYQPGTSFDWATGRQR